MKVFFKLQFLWWVKTFWQKKKKKKKRKYLKWGHRKTILNVKVKGRFENEVKSETNFL